FCASIKSFHAKEKYDACHGEDQWNVCEHERIHKEGIVIVPPFECQFPLTPNHKSNRSKPNEPQDEEGRTLDTEGQLFFVWSGTCGMPCHKGHFFVGERRLARAGQLGLERASALHQGNRGSRVSTRPSSRRKCPAVKQKQTAEE